MPDASSLHSRPPAYEVMRECLARQKIAAPRSAIARFFGVRPLHEDAVSWYSGALGELRVGSLLESLGSEWTVLHAVPVGVRGSDIDHVLVGPGGTFTVNTKRHPGAIVWLAEQLLLVAGQKTDYLRNARHEAERAAKLLTHATGQKVAVTPVVVLVGISSMKVKKMPPDVVVLSDAQLSRWLARRKPVLPVSAVSIISAAAANVRTWHKTAEVTVDAELMTAFEALRLEDDKAQRRQRVWGAVSVTALVIVSGLVAWTTLMGALSGS